MVHGNDDLDDIVRLSSYSPSHMGQAYGLFVRRYPSYAKTDRLDDLRRTEYTRLDRLGDVYLDYTGGGLYAMSQVEQHHEILSEHVLGNPHSHNPTSLESTRFLDEARAAVSDFFRASPSEYEIIFTANSSGALKLVGESYPFGPGSRYLLGYDNHNSVNGIREFARRAGADVIYVPVRNPDLRMDAELVERALTQETDSPHRLFAYPAQSNFSGVQHPLAWIEQAHASGWDVTLDSAAFVPTNRLDLGSVKPDFVPISFYKMFGYPTGVGALIARKEALAKLNRPWFAGGTITMASVQEESWYHLAPGATGFEDGTVDYLGLPAVTIGLRHLESIGIEIVHDRVTALAAWLLQEMGALRHENGAPLVQVFGPQDMEARGATIAFYLLDPHGTAFDMDAVERLAGKERISIRTGCFCNPGDGEIAHHITRDEMAGCFDEPEVPVTLAQCQHIIQDATGKIPNTIRVSLGIASDFSDVYRFMQFASSLRDRGAEDIS